MLFKKLTIRAEAEKAKESVVAESNIFGFDIETILESTLTDLYSASKSRANVAGLAKAKELAAKFKQAGTAKIEAQRALADKIKGQEVTKTVVIIAGGDGDAAKEGENGYTLTTFIKSLGGGNDMISAEEYATVKDAIEIEGEVDQAITDAEEGKSNDGYNENAELDGSGRRAPLVNEDAIEDTIEDTIEDVKEDVKEEAIEDVKEEATKPKLYEGMSIAERFKALM